MKAKDHKIEQLQRVPLFAACDDRDLKEISKLVDEVGVPAGHVLIEEGSTNCREAFIIIEGNAGVSVRGVQLAVLGPGSFTGEMSVLDHQERSATVVALTDVRMLVVDARGLHALVEKHGVGWKILKEMGQRVRALESEAAPALN